MRQPNLRLDYIDGLRGIAAMSVIFQHTGELMVFGLPNDNSIFGRILWALFENFVNWGRVGVIAFFCISGFVIPYSFKAQRPLANFVISRFFRLYPLYWLSLALALLIVVPITGQHITPLRMLSNFTMLQGFVGKPDILGPYWTLFYELVFYIFCFVAFAGRQLQSAKFLFGAFLVLLLSADFIEWSHHHGFHWWIYNLHQIPYFLSFMVFGALARKKYLDDDPFADKVFYPCLAVLCVLIAPIDWWVLWPTKYFHHLPFMVAPYIGLGLFILAAQWKLFTGRVAVFLGQISFSLYLLHPILLVVAKWLADKFIYPINDAVLAVLVFGTAIPLSYAVFIVLEKPAIKLGHGLGSSVRLGRWLDFRPRLTARD